MKKINNKIIFENNTEFKRFMKKILKELDLSKADFIPSDEFNKTGRGKKRQVINVVPNNELDTSEIIAEVKIFEEKLRKLNEYNEKLEELNKIYKEEVERLKETIKNKEGISLSTLENDVKKLKKEIGSEVDEIANTTLNKAFVDIKNDVEKIKRTIDGFILKIATELGDIKIEFGSAKNSISYSQALKKLPEYFKNNLMKKELTEDIDLLMDILNESINEVKEVTRIVKNDSRKIIISSDLKYIKPSNIKSSTKENLFYNDNILDEINFSNVKETVINKIKSVINLFIKFKNKLMIKLGLLDINKQRVNEVVSKWI